jgi:hypothetical protein
MMGDNDENVDPSATPSKRLRVSGDSPVSARRALLKLAGPYLLLAVMEE